MNSRFKRLFYDFAAIILSTAGLSLPQNVQGQTSAYIVTDLSNDDATQVPSKLNNLGDLVGRGARDGVLAQVQPCAEDWSRLPRGVNDHSDSTGDCLPINTSDECFQWDSRLANANRVPHQLPGPHWRNNDVIAPSR